MNSTRLLLIDDDVKRRHALTGAAVPVHGGDHYRVTRLEMVYGQRRRSVENVRSGRGLAAFRRCEPGGPGAEPAQ